ncbi:MAG TPA: hypothetical protein VFX89_14640 [Gammaproteobacteria bacterium]|nr:hypothetical protein [Gammaproteobacteria bacterium]
MAALSSSTLKPSSAHPATAAFARAAALALAMAVSGAGDAGAQEPAGAQPADPSHSDVRAATRLVHRGTAVTEAQASELTLTLTEAAVRPIQTWIRTAGKLDESARLLTTFVRSPEAELVMAGQRVRAFPVAQRTQMYQARIVRVMPEPGGARVEASITGRDFGTPYLMEIVVEQGPFLSVPNASIIEEGTGKVVYVQQAKGEYSPRTIHTGVEGELYTQVTDGLAEGDQIVSIGSFFVDADTKLKSGSE